MRDLGLKVSGDAEIDLVMAYVSGSILHVVICEVKRADTYPWQKECSLPNRQAVNKAENQLTKDVEVLMAIMAGTSSIEIIFHTLACFPDASTLELETIFCSSCLNTGAVSQEDLADLSMLQKKTQVPDKPDPATTSGKKKLLTLTARLLSHQSFLHIGYREVGDKEKLITERHRYNLETVDGKLMQKEFVVASPQQQQIIANFTTASPIQRHLVLEGPAGTGKTLVALQVANNLVNGGTFEEVNEPLLVVTADQCSLDEPIMKHLDANAGEGTRKITKGWNDVIEEFELSQSANSTKLLELCEGLSKKWEGRQIVLLVDEIFNKAMLSKLGEQRFPEFVRMVLILNPILSDTPLALPDTFLHVALTTPYRSTIAITSLARFLAKCKGLEVPEGEIGSDIEGYMPIFFEVGRDEMMLQKVFKVCQKQLGDNATILYDSDLPNSMEKMVKKQGKMAGGPWDCYSARDFYGWEAERVVVVTGEQ